MTLLSQSCGDMPLPILSNLGEKASFSYTLGREKLRLRKRKAAPGVCLLPASLPLGAPQSGVLVTALTDFLPLSLLQAASVLDVRYASAS